MIKKSDLIAASRTKTIPNDLIQNMNDYINRINMFESLCNLPILHTSFYRSANDQIEIYKSRGINNPPMQSQHMYCRAGDIADNNGKLKQWIINNIWALKQCGFWCEDFKATPTWVHFQTVPPKSGKRFFLP